MRQNLLIYSFFFLNIYGLLGQATLSGTVIDGANQEPVPFATVYFDGTTNGQTTDDNGRFSLSLQDIELPAVLVVSHVSYATKTMTVNTAEEKLSLVLTQRSQVMGTVVVQDRNQRQKNIMEFRRLFLGSDPWGENARILNEEALVFARDYVPKRISTTSKYLRRSLAKANRRNMEWAPDSSYLVYDKAVNLQATAKVPLVIELPDLGYSLQVDLVGFQVEYEQGTTSYFGHYFFKPQEGFEGKPRARHQKNRQRAYFNSSLHFLRALFAQALAENGYQLLEQITDEVTGKPSVLVFDINPYLHFSAEETLEIRDLDGRSFVLLYYGDQRGRPVPESKWKRTQPVQSGFHLGEKVGSIRADGTVGYSNLFFSGHIGSRGVAWLLPSDYGL